MKSDGMVRISFTYAYISPKVDKLLKSVTRGQCNARHTVTFPAAGHYSHTTGTKLYCLWHIHNLPKVAT